MDENTYNKKGTYILGPFHKQLFSPWERESNGSFFREP